VVRLDCSGKPAEPIVKKMDLLIESAEYRLERGAATGVFPTI
jgi:hypothetical protein